MKRMTLCSIFLLVLVNAVNCKKYLVEVDDDNLKDNLDNGDILGDEEKGDGDEGC